MDGQVTWDPYLSPSGGSGVTTAIMGNCGVGFAPCAASRREFLMNLVEAIEDIPGTAIMEGLVWEWETFEVRFRSLFSQAPALYIDNTLNKWKTQSDGLFLLTFTSF